MNGDFSEIDDLLIDRLVDGELPADERRRVIASLDARPDGWRRCALAFLEAQSFRGAMKSVVAGPHAAVVRQAATTALATLPSRPSPVRNSASSAAYWLTITAALFVAFGLGWQANQPGDSPEMQLAIDGPPQTPQVDRLPSTGDNVVTLVVQDQNGKPQRVRVPLVEGSRLGQAFADSPQWAAPAVREQLQQQGIDLRARRRYAPLFFEQQDRMVPMIVPVDDAVITPVSRPVY
jgi:anti-sigma factor RsiW